MKQDLTGMKFGFWSVLNKIAERGKHGEAYWLCKCRCGLEKGITAGTLKNGTSTKCYSCASKQHGMEGSKTYNTWTGMIQRCENPKNVAYGDYGGRGIQVCEEWHTFTTFFADMGIRPDGYSIDRIDSARGYCKENCKWSTPKEQIRNRRNTKKYQFEGKEGALGDLADAYGIPVRRVQQRMALGWDLGKALTTPVIARKPKE